MRRLLASTCIVTALAVAQARAQDKRPNVVLFMVDDLGWKDLSCMGSDFYDTPNIDGLAAHGMLFTTAYSNGPNGLPGRASLMSGLYPPWHRMITVGKSARGPVNERKLEPIENTRALAPMFVTIAETLQRAGYATGSIGKWHLTPSPRDQGFAYAFGGSKAGALKNGYTSPYRAQFIPDGPEGEYMTDRLTDEAIAFLRQQEERPFFLFLSHFAVHAPHEAKPDLVERYESRKPGEHHDNATYAAMIESIDQSLGRILEELERSDRTDNTLVIVTSDNGGLGTVTSMAPLRGSKGMIYEGGIRVPLIMKWPRAIQPGRQSSTPVIGLDLYPTIVEATRSLPPEEYPLEGVSLMPLLTDRGSLERELLYWHFPVYVPSYKGRPEPFRSRPCGAIRDGRYKLIEWFEDGNLELFDLQEDIGETKNLADEMPEKTEALHTALENWRKRTPARKPVDPNRYYKNYGR